MDVQSSQPAQVLGRFDVSDRQLLNGVHALARRRDFEGGRWRVLDVPAFVYRQILGAALGTIAQSVKGNSAAAFEQENYLLFYFGFIRERWKAQLSRARNRNLGSGSGAMHQT